MGNQPTPAVAVEPSTSAWMVGRREGVLALLVATILGSSTLQQHPAVALDSE
jgi:hypothetical protein